ncbi:MAG: hypothetical protein WBK64_10625 [Dethiobacteria bacterium]
MEIKHAVAEADDIIASHDTNLNVNPDYPPELQPRQREGAALEAQVRSIAGRMNPARLGENPMITDGATIVGPRKWVMNEIERHKQIPSFAFKTAIVTTYY